VNVDEESRLILEPLTAKRQRPGWSLPGRDAGHPPYGAGGHRAVSSFPGTPDSNRDSNISAQRQASGSEDCGFGQRRARPGVGVTEQRAQPDHEIVTYGWTVRGTRAPSLASKAIPPSTVVEVTV
jgi:hypothetical protein